MRFFDPEMLVIEGYFSRQGRDPATCWSCRCGTYTIIRVGCEDEDGHEARAQVCLDCLGKMILGGSPNPRSDDHWFKSVEEIERRHKDEEATDEGEEDVTEE